MAFYFPEDYGVKDSYVNSLIEYNDLLLQDLNDTNAQAIDKIKKINEYFLSLTKPKIHHPYDKNNFIKINDMTFENTCFILEERGVSSPAEINLYSFISRIKKIKEEISKKK